MEERRSQRDARTAYWDERYRAVGVEHVSWFEEHPALSLGLLTVAGATTAGSVIDVGGGASSLAPVLVAAGCGEVTVLDVSAAALDAGRERADVTERIDWVQADLLTWTPERRWAAWHDRAVFHFLTDPADRATYRELMGRSVEPGGAAVVIGFAEDGPTSCSGLEVHRCTPEQLLVEATPGFVELASGHAVHATPTGAVQRLSFVVARAPRP